MRDQLLAVAKASKRPLFEVMFQSPAFLRSKCFYQTPMQQGTA